MVVSMLDHVRTILNHTAVSMKKRFDPLGSFDVRGHVTTISIHTVVAMLVH